MTRSSAGDSRSVEGSVSGSRYQIRSRRLLRHPRIRPVPINSRNDRLDPQQFTQRFQLSAGGGKNGCLRPSLALAKKT